MKSIADRIFFDMKTTPDILMDRISFYADVHGWSAEETARVKSTWAACLRARDLLTKSLSEDIPTASASVNNALQILAFIEDPSHRVQKLKRDIVKTHAAHVARAIRDAHAQHEAP